MVYDVVIIIFFVGVIPHRQRGCSKLLGGANPHVIFLLSPVSCLLSPSSIRILPFKKSVVIFVRYVSNCKLIQKLVTSVT